MNVAVECSTDDFLLFDGFKSVELVGFRAFFDNVHLTECSLTDFLVEFERGKGDGLGFCVQHQAVQFENVLAAVLLGGFGFWGLGGFWGKVLVRFGVALL